MTKRILVIDDDEYILAILNLIFIDEGYDVIVYKTGKTIDHIKILHPDIIILDVKIDGFEKTGPEICSELKSQSELRNIPVMLLSAEDNLSSLASSCGANGYVSKPFDIYHLLAKVKEFIH